MTSAKILVVEDDVNLLATLKYNLQRESYDVVSATDGAQALEVARREKPDLIVLDLMPPELSGYEVCRILRKETAIPILMLTAKTEEVDKVVGLEIGADDYVSKPFSMRELLARIKALLRRGEMKKPQSVDDKQPIEIDDLKIDIARHQVFLGGLTLELTPKEFDLLTFLARNKGYIFSREQLLNKVWGYDYAGDTRTVDVHVRWLRQKIEREPSKPKLLVTVRGAGYKLES
jgi:two-component system OmpR family response regulator